MIPALVLSATLASSLLKPDTISCHLWKRITDPSGQKICVYRGKNSTFGYHYVTDTGGVGDWAQCPKVFQCKYQPKNKRPTIGEIMQGIQGGCK